LIKIKQRLADHVGWALFAFGASGPWPSRSCAGGLAEAAHWLNVTSAAVATSGLVIGPRAA